MHTSGIWVRVRPGEARTVARNLEGSPGLEIRRVDEIGGHLVVVLESATRAGQEEGLRRVQARPGVLAAALVAHHVDDPPTAPPPGKEPPP